MWCLLQITNGAKLGDATVARAPHIAVEIQILKLPLFRQLMINFSLACELLLSQILLNKYSASTTESTIPFAKKFSW